VDERFTDLYGYLQKIKAEFYKYRTQPIIVTESSVVYDIFIEHLGEYFGDFYNADIGRSLYTDWLGATNWSWALNPYYREADYNESMQNILYYLFPVDDIEDDRITF
jgi:hypothetical protein